MMQITTPFFPDYIVMDVIDNGHTTIHQRSYLYIYLLTCLTSWSFQIGVTMTKMDQLPPSISEACMDEMSFIVYSLPVHELINSDLLGAFQKKGVSNVYIMIAYI